MLIKITLGFLFLYLLSCGSEDQETTLPVSTEESADPATTETDSSTNSEQIEQDTFAVTGSLNISGLGLTNFANMFVYAVNPNQRGREGWRRKAKVNDDGAFDLGISRGEPWIVSFIDQSQTGSAMTKGIFRSNSLNSIAPRAYESKRKSFLGTLNFKTRDVDSTTTCRKTKPPFAEIETGKHAEFISDLGMDAEDAELLGELDDLMLKYINPDMDGNGTIDMDEDKQINIDFDLSIVYTYAQEQNELVINAIQEGQSIPIDGEFSLVNYKPGIKVEIDSSVTSDDFMFTPPKKWEIEFSDSEYTGDNPMVYTESGIGKSQGPTSYGKSGNYWTISFPFPTAVEVFPGGSYTWKLYDSESSITPSKIYTFNCVRRLDKQKDVMGLNNVVIPFPIFNVDDSGFIKTISYTWLIRSGGTFKSARPADVERWVGKNDAQIRYSTVGNSGSTEDLVYLYFSPYEDKFSVTGEFDISVGSKGGMSSNNSEIKDKRSDIKSVTLGYTTKLGYLMRFYLNYPKN